METVLAESPMFGQIQNTMSVQAIIDPHAPIAEVDLAFDRASLTGQVDVLSMKMMVW